MNYSEYNSLEDEKLIALYREKPDDALMEMILNRYKPLVKNQAKMYYLAGGDEEDLNQEGMIGLFKAVRDFETEKNIGFANFAKMCVRRQMIKAIEASTRKKHTPLNSYVSFNKDDVDKNIEGDELLATNGANPESLIIAQEEYEAFEKKIYEPLSALEKSVLRLYLGGSDYIRIASELDRPPKSIDNALQRIRKKVKNLME